MSARKNAGQIRVWAWPEHGGAFTGWRMAGSVATAVPKRELRRLIAGLLYWSGWSVELVLPVEATTAGWLEWWADALGAIPGDHLKVCFVTASQMTGTESDE